MRYTVHKVKARSSDTEEKKRNTQTIEQHHQRLDKG